MPTVKNISGKYRFYFYSFDCNEPKHILIQREKMICKFWLEPVALCQNHGFSPKELNAIQKIVRNKLKLLMEAWYEHCGKHSRNTN